MRKNRAIKNEKSMKNGADYLDIMGINTRHNGQVYLPSNRGQGYLFARQPWMDEMYLVAIPGAKFLVGSPAVRRRLVGTVFAFAV